MHQNDQNMHIPVLLRQVLEYLDPQPSESYLDVTAGYGGHAEAILERTLNGKTVLIDRDENAVQELAKRFKGRNVVIRRQDFLTASRELLAAKEQFDMILADLGVSSPHLNTASRGFSIIQEGPLDMRMDQIQQLTAATIINTYSEAQLAEILWEYGEEPGARQIARLITRNRPFKTTTQLANIVAKSAGWRMKKRKIHPATRTFQAIRIAVNSELDLLKEALPLWIRLLKPGGRIAVISFHSLEDRLVKQAFADASGERYDAELRLLTKHTVTGDKNEIVSNPRARSAKLRAAVKIKIYPPKNFDRKSGGKGKGA